MSPLGLPAGAAADSVPLASRNPGGYLSQNGFGPMKDRSIRLKFLRIVTGGMLGIWGRGALSGSTGSQGHTVLKGPYKALKEPCKALKGLIRPLKAL